MRYNTIEDFVATEHPDAWTSGKWGTCHLQAETLDNLKVEEPSGKLIDTIAGQYWFWLT
jgi:hypothetical protein